MSGLLACCYAAARKHLKLAREAQLGALYAGLGVYRAGSVGRIARAERKRLSELRAAHMIEAFRIRTKIRALRAELERDPRSSSRGAAEDTRA